MDKSVASEQGTNSIKSLSMVRQRLAQARSKSIRLIQDEIDRRGGVGISNEDMGKLSGRINEMVGRGLQDVFSYIWHSEKQADAKATASFYFAPGYSQYTKQGSRRIDTTPEIIVESMTIGEKYKQYGYGFTWRDNKVFYCFILNVWMWHFYEKKVNGHELYGFTKWFELNQEDQPMHIKQEEDVIGGKNTIPIVAICIRSGSQIGKRSAKNGVLNLVVPKSDDPQIIYKTFKIILNDEGTWIEENNPRYRFPIFKHATLGIEKYPDEKVQEDGQYKTDKEYIEDVFALLCDSIFNNRDYGTWDEFRKVKQKYGSNAVFSKKLKEMEKDIQALTSKDHDKWFNPQIEFKYYYAIPLDKSLNIEAYNILGNMGTANLYTCHKIPDAYLFIIRTWLSDIYAQVRLCDAMTDANIAGFKTMLTAYSHEVQKIGEKLARDFLIPLSDVFDINEIVPSLFNSKWLEDPLPDSINDEMLKDEIGKYLVCPLPNSYRIFKNLYTLWGTSESILSDFNIPQNASMLQMINCLFPLTQEIAEIRKNRQVFIKIRDFNIAKRLNSRFKADKDIIDPLIKTNIDDFIKFTLTDDIAIKRKQNYLVRCLIAMIANSLFHASDVSNVSLYGSCEKDSYIFGIQNKFENPINNTKLDSFTEGTKAVMMTCLKEINGYAYKFDSADKYDINTEPEALNNHVFVSEFSFKFKDFMELKCNPSRLS
jgi:hypothetical protein